MEFMQHYEIQSQILTQQSIIHYSLFVIHYTSSSID